MRALLLFQALLLGLQFAVDSCWAHEHWISKERLTDPVTKEWCCGENDCKMVPKEGIVATTGGYFLPETKETIPYSRVLWISVDGWWRCHNPQKATRCLIGPPQGL